MWEAEVNVQERIDMSGIVNLDALAIWRQRLKEEEQQVKDRLAEVDDMIIMAIGDLPEEGTTTRKTGQFKISVTTKLTRTLDYEAYLAVESGIPESVRCVDLEPKINLKKLRAIDLVRPNFSSAFITTKPSKPQIKIEALA